MSWGVIARDGKFSVACDHCRYAPPFRYATREEAKMVAARDANKTCPVCRTRKKKEAHHG